VLIQLDSLRDSDPAKSASQEAWILGAIEGQRLFGVNEEIGIESKWKTLPFRW
jgi:hypothetical protein